jgi:hypothetical protein
MPARATQSLPRIIVLSGGTGHTADLVLKSALAQFPGNQVYIEYQTQIRSVRRAVAVAKRAAERGAVICHSLVVPKIRQAFEAEVRRLGVPCIDALGPALALLGERLGSVPRGRAGLLYELHHEQLDRMDAVDFTLAHDDGKRVRDLKQADVVLVGASRTSKSVTCFYLAYRGIRAANVPLIPGLPPPPELIKVNRQRVIGLTMNAAHLESIRQSRLDRITHQRVPNYASLREIQAELREIRELMSRHRWECIDISYKATEEVAELIIEMIPERKRPKNSAAPGT